MQKSEYVKIQISSKKSLIILTFWNLNIIMKLWEGGIEQQAQILSDYERDMVKYTESSMSNRIISAFDSIPVQLAKDNKKFQYKVISRGGTASIFGEAILWLKNSGIVNQVYKAKPELPIEMHKDLASFKLYMSDVGLFVNKARYPLYQIDLSQKLRLEFLRKILA